MAVFVLTDCVIWVHDQDVGGISNSVGLNPTVDDQDVTTFGSGGFRAKVGGLRTVDLSAAGFADSLATPDAAFFAALGVVDRAVTVAPTSPAASVAYLFQAGEFEYNQFGDVGDPAPFTLSMSGTNTVGLVRGQLAKAKGAVAATGVLGSGVLLGPGGAGKFLYATLHIFTAGTTITVIVQSDDNAGFTTPTTVATIGPLTTSGGTWMTRVNAAAITDSYFRFNVSAITGSFTVGGALAMQ